MELKIWSRTFLNIYGCLERVTKAIDKIVLTTGLNSKMNVEHCANKMIELTGRKVTLINLKVFIEKLLNELPDKHAKLLLLKYVDGVKSEDVAKIFHISSRTYFRRSNEALKSFELALKRHGKTNEILLKEFKKEAWIMDLYKKLYQQEIQFKETKAQKGKLKNKEVDLNKVVSFAYSNYKKIEGASVFI